MVLWRGALPNSVMEPEWRPYALIVLDILRGSYERLTRRQTQENRTLFGQFVGRALEHLNQSGDTLVMLDGAKLRASVPGLQNSALAFDYFDLGQRIYRPNDLPICGWHGSTQILKSCPLTPIPMPPNGRRAYSNGVRRAERSMGQRRSRYSRKTFFISAQVSSQ